jgi:hypothetical protein
MFHPEFWRACRGLAGCGQLPRRLSRSSALGGGDRDGERWFARAVAHQGELLLQDAGPGRCKRQRTSLSLAVAREQGAVLGAAQRPQFGPARRDHGHWQGYLLAPVYGRFAEGDRRLRAVTAARRDGHKAKPHESGPLRRGAGFVWRDYLTMDEKSAIDRLVTARWYRHGGLAVLLRPRLPTVSR